MIASSWYRIAAACVTAMAAVAVQPAVAGPLRAAVSTQQVFAGNPADLYTLAVRATVWGYPLVRAAQLREKATQPDHAFAERPPTVATAPLNRLGRARQLADPETRIGVAPNNDTLYVLVFLDTNDGPFELDTPDLGSRYYIFQFGEADSSTRVSYGQSTHGRKLPPIFVVGPDYRGPVPAGMLVVHSTQRYLMIAVRILVTGAQDLPIVHQLEDRVTLSKWLGPGRLAPAPVSPQRMLMGSAGTGGSDPDELLGDLGTVLQDWRPSAYESALIRSLEPIGLTLRGGFQPGGLTQTQRDEIRSGIADGLAIIGDKTRHLGAMANGWSTSYAGSKFGTDYLLRAAVAMDQIYVVDKDEALYPVAHLDGSGAPLDGRRNYLLCFRKQDLPPVDGFWSITLYYAKGFLVPNLIRRYSIGDRTPGLSYGKDGSLKLYVQTRDPGPGKTQNWLPTPNEGFMLMMRLYRPKASAINERWHPPAVTPTTDAAGSCPAS